MNKIYVNDKIAVMLECILSEDGVCFNLCKKCSYADACCHLMKSVFVVHHVHYNESRKANSA